MPRILIRDLDSTEKGVGADMLLYFSGNFIKVSVDGEKPPIWAKYGGCNSSKGHTFTGAKETFYVVPKDPKAYIEWFCPSGWYNTKKSSVYCERIPKRQYYKGISNGHSIKFSSAESLAKEFGFFNTKDPETLEIMKELTVFSKVPTTVGEMESMFGDSSQHYPSLEESYVLLRAKKMFARALSSTLAIVPHPQTKDFIVFCNDVPVAELVTKNKVKVVVPEFKHECLDYFTKEGVSVV